MSKRLPCTHVGCNKDFPRPSDLLTHSRTFHGEGDLWGCPKVGCPRQTFQTEEGCASHIKKEHSELTMSKPRHVQGQGVPARKTNAKEQGQGQFRCSKCGSTFSQATSLKRHDDSMHNKKDEKPYKCPECENKFSDPMVALYICAKSTVSTRKLIYLSICHQHKVHKVQIKAALQTKTAAAQTHNDFQVVQKRPQPASSLRSLSSNSRSSSASRLQDPTKKGKEPATKRVKTHSIVPSQSKTYEPVTQNSSYARRGGTSSNAQATQNKSSPASLPAHTTISNRDPGFVIKFLDLEPGNTQNLCYSCDGKAIKRVLLNKMNGTFTVCEEHAKYTGMVLPKKKLNESKVTPTPGPTSLAGPSNNASARKMKASPKSTMYTRSGVVKKFLPLTPGKADDACYACHGIAYKEVLLSERSDTFAICREHAKNEWIGKVLLPIR